MELSTLSGREGESKRSCLGTTGYLRDGQIVVLAIELLLYLAKVWIRHRRKAGSVVVVQSLSCVQLFVTPCQAPLSSTITQGLLKFMSIESVILSNHLISAAFFFCLQSFPASGSFPVSQLFASGGQRIGASASASVLPVNVQGWFPLGLTGLIALLSTGPLRVFSSTTVRKHQFFSAQLSSWSNSHVHKWLLEEP